MSLRQIVRMLLVVLLVPSATAAQEASFTGTVVSLSSVVEVQRNGTVTRLREGDSVEQGDIVRTGPQATAQLVFADETRIALGASSTLRIDETLLARRGGVARRFTVSALGGSYRFLSGNSPKNAYAIRTPTATMGIRGTVFDVSVRGTDGTDLVVFDGRVRFCGDGRRCEVVPPGCNAVSVGRQNVFVAPETLDEKTQLLIARFPFLRAQATLRPDFRANLDGCDEDNTFELSTAQPEFNRKDGNQGGRRSGNPAE